MRDGAVLIQYRVVSLYMSESSPAKPRKKTPIKKSVKKAVKKSVKKAVKKKNAARAQDESQHSSKPRIKAKVPKATTEGGTTAKKSTRSSPAKKAAVRKSARKAAPRNTKKPFKDGVLWRWRKLWLFSALVLFLLQVIYLGWLQYRISNHFAGGQWDLPSRVYARPLELYEGLKLSPEQLRYELQLVGYQAVSANPQAGEFSEQGGHWQIHRRAFAFAGSKPKSRVLQFDLSGQQLSQLKDENNQPLGLARLEPWLLGEFIGADREDRELLSFEQIAPRLIEILLAVEDRGFYQHHGVSPLAIVRALYVNLRAGRTVQGGSTLTQQLAKNFFLDQSRTLLRKYHEAWLALLLEAQYSKQQILTAYINEVFLLQLPGRAVHGFGLSSRLLFNRPLHELNDAQLALLVGMIKGPSYYQPLRHPERAKARREVVLKVMQQQGLISAAEFQRLNQQALGVVRQLPGRLRHQSYLTLVSRQLRQYFDAAMLKQQGLLIMTPFDPWQQHLLDQAVRNSALLQQQKNLQSAAVIADVATAEILAINSDRNPEYAGFNRALDAYRPIGSLFKPVILTALLQHGASLQDRYDDAPITLKQSDGKLWQPQNYDKKFHGNVSLLTALQNSYNLPWVHAGLELGLPKIAKTMRQLGLEEPSVFYPSVLLGTLELSPLQLTELYQTFANQGFSAPLSAIRDVVSQDGELLQRFPYSSTTRLDAKVADEVLVALRAVVQHGTARKLGESFNAPLHGKTGTSSDKRDSWFVGFDQRKLGVFWVGRDDNQPAGLSGSTGAMRLFADWYQAP